MNRCKYVVCIALFASAACSADLGDGADFESDEAEAKGTKSKPPKYPVPAPPTVPPDAPPAPDASPAPDAPLPEPSGGTPGFIDACLLPGMTKATFSPTGSIDAFDEGVTAALSLPFSFTLYGTSHTKYWLTTNGQLGFGNTVGGSAFGQVTCPLADSRFTTPIVLAYSADLIGRYDAHAGVCYATTGTAPSRKHVVTWKDSFFYDAWLTSNVTFSVTLNEGTNVIDVVIERVDAPESYFESGSMAVLGRQAGSSAQTFSCYQALAPEGTVIHYSP
ncbi:MAG TPA: hypothetical protein VK932_16285 [Kofleriaceae bacterium]|nr:hypothetical protein [Kofleriaceae bacterium]